MIVEGGSSWFTDACIICGGIVGAGLGFWWHDYSGAVFGAVIGVLVGYALSKPN